ncbi:hypothetical protein A3A54_02465 [Candidatus Curtissbacteria bacterium RIFCSPLOWO2_01_FULL_39_62]|uniref:S1 motif domain-containing protein n=2 Tax=Candidatus Curtissiibacteriota TaxID=1752717 RepID=A0A1F5G9P6_9BACT|nr:MAG: hypothetical protein A3D04_03200 [Candidatus Curtissbacteria bacterium RIFCSPHIGHO2_02_FULL_40_16b]OGE00405.1 MAG: hypothetical protein A3J17_02080 [Candidatus Curtissbacteria bacterium RIFCSPLOWO2_02_FULL_40_11]OGE00794.1 MAG: hypothetical protein A3A54_02465 [Candidatus Curtissbacteria bacterium RIFCSPLOWO2_01_FULL_39_62]OGE12898.1 MAG: hypothetical protein A3G14_03750 [Candidatus Curtissbacteria bacterium RIFCSPLOWO2_12_FULL_38_9]
MVLRPVRKSQGKQAQDKHTKSRRDTSPKSSKKASFARSIRSTLSTSSGQAHSGQVSLRASDKKLSFADLFKASESKVPALKRNQEVSGKIVSVSRNELLVDIGAKSEGLLAGHELTAAADLVSDLSVGDPIEATVLYPENDAGQVVLSLRKLSGEKRWKELEEKKENHEDIDVVAMEVNRGGVICEYLGIRGFLPASQLVKAPSKLEDLIGKTLNARVIEVDKQSNRLILSQKQPEKKDLKEVVKLLSKVKIGEEISGVVTAVLPFGIFVEVDIEKEIGRSGDQVVRKAKKSEPDDLNTQKPDNLSKLEGLVHISEISWEKVEDPAKYFKVGDKTDVIVIAKENETGRLNLSIKQLSEDPFVEVSKDYTKDKEVKGTISRVTPYGVIVELTRGIEGLIHISKLPPNENFDVGQSVECSVEAVDTKSRKISLVPLARTKPVLYR